MDKQAMIAFMRSNPNFQLATVDTAGKPHTRGMALYRAEETGIVFHTGAFKDLYRQLKGNSWVELSFFEAATMRQLRVEGRAMEVEDDAYRQMIVDTPGREFLKPVVAAHGLGAIRVFRVGECRAIAWDMASNTTYPKPVVAW